MKRWSWFVVTLAALLSGGCSGGRMLAKGDRAPAFPAGLRTIDGSAASLSDLSSKGPLVLVLLRGFS
jgi:hypothetical protein